MMLKQIKTYQQYCKELQLFEKKKKKDKDEDFEPEAEDSLPPIEDESEEPMEEPTEAPEDMPEGEDAPPEPEMDEDGEPKADFDKMLKELADIQHAATKQIQNKELTDHLNKAIKMIEEFLSGELPHEDTAKTHMEDTKDAPPLDDFGGQPSQPTEPSKDIQPQPPMPQGQSELPKRK